MGARYEYSKFQAFDDNGILLSGGKLYTYVAGTATNKLTYSDVALTSANANPVILDSRGEASVYGSGTYKFVLKDSDDNTIWTEDDVAGIGAAPSIYEENAYYVDSTATDQGAATVEGDRSVKDFVDSIGTSSHATIIFPRGTTGNNTAYTFSTSETIPSNITLVFERGANLSIGDAVTVTIQGNIEAGAHYLFGWSGTGAVSLNGGTIKECYPEWWGVTGDGSTDDYAALLAAITASVGLKLFFSNPGTYMVSQKLTLPGTGIFIDAVPGVWLKASAVMDYILGNTDPTYATQQLRIHNLLFDGDDKAVNCLYLYKISNQNFDAVNGVRAYKATDDGIKLIACQGGAFRNIYADYNAGNGVSIQGANGAKFYGIKAMYNTLSGIEVTLYNDGTNYAGACSLFGCSGESNTLDGITVTDCYNVLILGGWEEGNTRDGIRITDSRVVVNGARISGTGDGTNYAIHITSGAGVVATGNQIDYDGNITFQAVKDLSGLETNVVSPNYGYTGALLAIHPWMKATEINSPTIIGDGASGAQGDITSGTAVAAAATGGTDTFVVTITTTAGAITALELELIGEFGGLHDKGVYKKFIFYAGVGTGVVYDASITEHLTLGDASKADITAGTPTTVGGQPQYTITFTNANAAAFTGFIRVVSYSTLAVTYAVANNQ